MPKKPTTPPVVEPTPRHGVTRVHRPWGTLLRAIGLGLSVILVSSAAIVGIVTWKITSSINTVSIDGELGSDEEIKLAAIGEMKGAFNVLIVGSDTRAGQRAMFGTDVTSALNDVNIIVHVAEDHKRAIAVSIPRDLVIPIPSCPREDGSGDNAAMSAQPINVALSYGGLNCAVLTVQELTGLEIKYAGLVTFGGVASLADAVGGVDVCINAPIHDSYTGLDLPRKGKYTLQGWQALQFLRSRHGVGDGSDLGRISSQQVYMSALVRKLQDSGTLLNPASLYGIASTAATSMTLSRSLSSVDTMVAMALVLKDIPKENILFLQYPGTTGLGGIYQSKVAPLTDLATQLFTMIKDDEPFALDANATGPGSEVKNPTPAPTATATATAKPGKTATPDPNAEPVLAGVKGQSAAQTTCSVAYHY